MRKLFESTGNWISNIIDFFHPPFRKYVSIQLFRYGASGAANILFDWALYFVIFHFVLNQQMLHLGFVTMSSHIAAYFLTFPITLMTGFLLQKYVTFTASDLRGRVQLYRYSVVVAINILINYVGFKLLVDVMGVFPLPSKMLITVFTTIFSYVSQKRYTFKIPKNTSLDS